MFRIDILIRFVIITLLNQFGYRFLKNFTHSWKQIKKVLRLLGV